MAVKLTLSATGETTVQGDVRFFRLDNRQRAEQQPSSWYRVQGTYDPALLTFSLAPDGWVEEPRPRTRSMHPLGGVFDPRQPALAGEVETPRPPAGRLPVYFVLARPNHAGDLTRAVLGEPARRVRARMPDDAGLIRWASRLAVEYPGLDPRRTLGDVFQRITFNLFEDQYFRTHFGLTFDQLSARQRDAVRERFRKRPNPELQQFARLEGAFRTGGLNPPRYQEYVLPVMAQRVIRGWRDMQLARMGATQPTTETIREFQGLSDAGEAYIRPLWPSEWAHFQQVYDESYNRLAGPALAANVDELVARQPSYEVAVALASWEQESEEVLVRIPESRQAELRARAEGRLDEVLEVLMAQETRALENLGSGSAAVAAGNRWYADLRQRYAFAGERAPIARAVARLQERRPADLAAATAELGQRIGQLRTTADVRDLMRTTLAVPGDRQTESGGALAQLAAQRTRELDRTAFLAPFSPNERRLLGGGDRIAVGAIYDPPDRNDVHRALLRAYIDIGGVWVDPNTVGFTVAGILFAMDVDVTADVRRIRVLNPGAGQSYDVDVDFGVRLALPAELKDLAMPMLDFINLFAGMRREVHTFELTPEGWKSPTFHRGVVQGLPN